MNFYLLPILKITITYFSAHSSVKKKITNGRIVKATNEAERKPYTMPTEKSEERSTPVIVN